VAGYRVGLVDSAIMAKKRTFERDFRRRVESNPSLKAKYGDAWNEIAKAEREQTSFATELLWHSFGGGSNLLNFAGGIVRVPLMATLPDSARLPQYRGQGIDRIRQTILAPTPLDTAFERMTLAATLAAWKEALPASDPIVAAALAYGGGDPTQAAAKIIQQTTLLDPAARRALIEGGTAAAAASKDPLKGFHRRRSGRQYSHQHLQAGRHCLEREGFESRLFGRVLLELAH
jgi:hypothetical protein